MCKLGHLTTLWAPAIYYRDNFTFLYSPHRMSVNSLLSISLPIKFVILTQMDSCGWLATVTLIRYKNAPEIEHYAFGRPWKRSAVRSTPVCACALIPDVFPRAIFKSAHGWQKRKRSCALNLTGQPKETRRLVVLDPTFPAPYMRAVRYGLQTSGVEINDNMQ
jgi:hypothetical protein